MALVPLVAQGATHDTTVVSAGTPRYQQLATTVEELTLGRADGPEQYTFATINDVAIAPTGNILVLDAAPNGANPLLRLYTVTGQFIRRVGSVGAGPGEYRRPSCVATFPDGRFALYDRANARITIYSSEGAYLESWRVPPYNVASGGDVRMRIGPDGIIAMRITQSIDLPAVTQAIVRIGAGAAIVDTLPVPVLPSISTFVTRSVRRGNAVQHGRLMVPYSPQNWWQWSPLGYFVTARSDRYALDFRIPRGVRIDGRLPPVWSETQPVVSARMSARPVPVEARERIEQRSYAQSQLRGLPGDPVPEVPPTKPFFQFMYMGDDGRIWTRVHVRSQRDQSGAIRGPGWHEPITMDVFEPHGAYVGRVRFPDGLNFLRFRGDHIWAVAHDDDGIAYVKRYRARWE